MRFFLPTLAAVAALCVQSSCLMPTASANYKPVQAAADTQPAGVVVEAVETGSPAEKAGLRVGDILRWYGTRPLRSAFAFSAAWENTFGVTTITLKGLRANQPLTLHLPVHEPGTLLIGKTPEVSVRPQWPTAVQSLYEAGQLSVAGGHIKEGIVSWQDAVAALEDGGDKDGAAWLCARMGVTYSMQSDWKHEQQWLEHAWENVKSGSDFATQAIVLHGIGDALENQNDLAGALNWYEQARKLNVANQNIFWQANDLIGEGKVAFTSQDLKKARKLHEQALNLCQPLAPASWQTGSVLYYVGRTALFQSDYASAQRYYEAALPIFQKQTLDSQDVAAVLSGMASVAFNQNRFPQGMEYSRQALAVYRREKPEADEIIDILVNMGQAAALLENYRDAQKYFDEALPLVRKQRPDTLYLANVLAHLGSTTKSLGGFSQSEAYTQEALNIRHKFSPGSPEEVESYTQLGYLAVEQGKLETGRKYMRNAISFYEKIKPVPFEMVGCLTVLATIAVQEGDISTAQGYYKRALALCRIKRPNSPQEAIILNMLNLTAMPQNGSVNTQTYALKADAILEKHTSNPLQKARLLHGLSIAASERGEWNLARQYAQQSFDLLEKFAPDSSNTIGIYALLGYIELQQKDFKNAQGHFQQMLGMTQKFAPDSLQEAYSRSFLGYALLEQHKNEDALKQFAPAVTIVEARRQRLANPESRAFLLEQHSVPFLGMMRAQIALNHKNDAFETLERSRARSLVDLLSERKPSSSPSPIPDEPQKLVEKQKQLLQQRDEFSQQLLAVDLSTNAVAQQAKAATLREKIRALDVDQRQLETDIRQASPHYAGLRYPKPLTFAEAQQTLDEGTLLLTYALGEKESYLFTVTKTSSRVIALPVGEEALGRKVAELRGGLQSDGNYQECARWLYQTLVAPARKEIDASRRLLLCPDGVLNTLPFAALVTSLPDKPVTHLVELKPMHVIASLSLYRELRQTQISRTGKILALADPDYGSDSAAVSTPGGRSAFHKSEIAPNPNQLPSQSRMKAPPSPSALRGKERAGVRLPSIHETRQQITALQKLYGKRVEAHVGKQATTAVIRQARSELAILHLACHGWVDNGDPLSSALVLSSNGAGHGFLTASDILRLKLPADLVMLSACDTGLGKQTQFEGVVGLTRAFQYAGAHMVGVSLWNVNVDSTTELMNQFYAGYKAGMSKDVALQKAQIAMLHDRLHSDWKHPHYWAAFQMVGDWK